MVLHYQYTGMCGVTMGWVSYQRRYPVKFQQTRTKPRAALEIKFLCKKKHFAINMFDALLLESSKINTWATTRKFITLNGHLYN